SVRRPYLLEAARNPAVAVVLCDVMLGWGAHPDPAGVLAATWQEAQAAAQTAGRTLVGIVHVCGAPDDPQGLELQCQGRREQGMLLADSNAQAVRLAAAVLGAHVRDSAARPLPVGREETHMPHDPISSSGILARLPALFASGPRVINLGLELF